MAKDNQPLLYLRVNDLSLRASRLEAEVMMVRRTKDQQEWGARMEIPILLTEDQKTAELIRDLKTRIAEVFEERMDLGVDLDASKPG